MFTDCPFPGEYPPNVKFVESSLADVADRVQVRTGITLQLRNAYKLCDLKPMYGLLFDDYLDGADYWGFGDIDLMYGRLNDYLSPVLERNADILSIRKEYVSGGFTLIRNCRKLRELFRDSPDWRRVLGTESYLSFDECAFAWDALRAGDSIREVETSIVSFTEVVFNAIRRGKVTGRLNRQDCASYQVMPGFPPEASWRGGRDTRLCI